MFSYLWIFLRPILMIKITCILEFGDNINRAKVYIGWVPISNMITKSTYLEFISKYWSFDIPSKEILGWLMVQITSKKKYLIHELRQKKKKTIKRVKEASPITKQSFKWEILFALGARPCDTLHVLRLVKNVGPITFVSIN